MVGFSAPARNPGLNEPRGLGPLGPGLGLEQILMMTDMMGVVLNGVGTEPDSGHETRARYGPEEKP